MSFKRYANFQVTSAVLVPENASRGLRRRIAKRHNFDYTPRQGYLYVRSRAISSRTNDNYDEFPAEEIKKAYKTFIGKPVFVNHVNDNHKRARGVIIDAALHEDRLSDGAPNTWVEVLMEVDAKRFPKLAKAILSGRIDRTSMGCDVAYSVCSACGNKASTPSEYCQHIPRLKGKKIDRVVASTGKRETHLIRETCYGLGFFENSLLVEEPADPTAFFLGVDDHSGLSTAASKTAMKKITDEHGREIWTTETHDTDPLDYSQCTSKKVNPTFCNWHKTDHLETDGEPRVDVDGHGKPIGGHSLDIPQCDLCDGHHDSLHHYDITEGHREHHENESLLDGRDDHSSPDAGPHGFGHGPLGGPGYRYVNSWDRETWDKKHGSKGFSLTQHFASTEDCSCGEPELPAKHTDDEHWAWEKSLPCKGGHCTDHEFAHTTGEHFDLNQAKGLDAWGDKIKQPYDGHSAFNCNNYDCVEHPQSMYEDGPGPVGMPGWMQHDTASPEEKHVRREIGKTFHDMGMSQDAHYLLDQQHQGPSKYSLLQHFADRTHDLTGGDPESLSVSPRDQITHRQHLKDHHGYSEEDLERVMNEHWQRARDGEVNVPSGRDHLHGVVDFLQAPFKAAHDHEHGGDPTKYGPHTHPHLDSLVEPNMGYNEQVRMNPERGGSTDPMSPNQGRYKQTRDYPGLPNLRKHHDPKDPDTWTNLSACPHTYEPKGEDGYDDRHEHEKESREAVERGEKSYEDHAAEHNCPHCGAMKYLHAQPYSFDPSRLEMTAPFKPLRQSLNLLQHFASTPKVWWHGTPYGGPSETPGEHGVHVGTQEAARQALNARIGHRADGKDWDGTQEYGKTLLAGHDTLRSLGRSPNGYSVGLGGKRNAVKDDHYPSEATGASIPLNAKPHLFPVHITGPMSNDESTPHKDFAANGRMKSLIQRGQARRGYFYTNEAEDVGSISAVVPSWDHLTLADHKTSSLLQHFAKAQKPGKVDAPTHSGLVLKALDTGRVLMLQRSMEDEKDPARGTWEFPGGGHEDGDHTSLHAAIREWEEEVGQTFPKGGTVSHTWRSPNGVYQGHVITIPEEKQVALHEGRVVTNPDDPDGDCPEQAAWWDPKHAESIPNLRREVKKSPWAEIRKASSKTAGACGDCNPTQWTLEGVRCSAHQIQYDQRMSGRNSYDQGTVIAEAAKHHHRTHHHHRHKAHHPHFHPQTGWRGGWGGVGWFGGSWGYCCPGGSCAGVNTLEGAGGIGGDGGGGDMGAEASRRTATWIGDDPNEPTKFWAAPKSGWSVHIKNFHLDEGNRQGVVLNAPNGTSHYPGRSGSDLTGIYSDCPRIPSHVHKRIHQALDAVDKHAEDHNAIHDQFDLLDNAEHKRKWNDRWDKEFREGPGGTMAALQRVAESIHLSDDDREFYRQLVQHRQHRDEQWNHAERRVINLDDPVDLKQHMIESHDFEDGDFHRNSHAHDHPALGPAGSDDRPLTHSEIRMLHDHDHEIGDYSGTTLGGSHYHQASRRAPAEPCRSRPRAATPSHVRSSSSHTVTAMDQTLMHWETGYIHGRGGSEPKGPHAETEAYQKGHEQGLAERDRRSNYSRTAALTKTADEDQCPYCAGDSTVVKGHALGDHWPSFPSPTYQCEDGHTWSMSDPAAQRYHGDGPHAGVIQPLAKTAVHVSGNHTIWSKPAGEYPTDWANFDEHNHGVAKEHGPFFVTRHPETRAHQVVDKHNRLITSSAGSDGSNSEYYDASGHTDDVFHEINQAHGFHEPLDHKVDLQGAHDRITQQPDPPFEHTRTDPRIAEFKSRPQARVAEPTGTHSPHEEWHGPYEVVQHPETKRFHVVDNQGRNANAHWSLSDRDRKGHETQWEAESQRDHVDRRTKGREQAKGIVDGLFDGMARTMGYENHDDAMEQGRTDRNIGRMNELASRYEGGTHHPLHPGRFGSDDLHKEGDGEGEPYYEVSDPGGSGWKARDYGGSRIHIHHEASEHAVDAPEPHGGQTGGWSTPGLKRPGFGHEDLHEELHHWIHGNPADGDDAYGAGPDYARNEPAIERWQKKNGYKG